ncbi:MAG: DNA primase [Spirochaetaceae bacterium]|jgi:DNA primase|nr:DNA primase [Spirochaetaceae bacterium]
MSLISKITIQELNDRLDALAVVEDYVRLEKKGGRYWGLCPFHNEKTPSFTVDPDRKMYHCFGCGQGGGIINFVMEMDKLTFPEAVETLARRFGIEIIYENSVDFKREEGEGFHKKEELLELYRRVTVSFHHFLVEKPEGSKAFRYIVSRGISKDMVERFRLGYTPADRHWLFGFLSGKGYSEDFLSASGLFSESYPRTSFFSDRLMFPIADRQGNTAAFGGRILGEGEPKYLNSRESEIFKKRQSLYAVDLALPEIRKTKEVYLAEGYMDVIALHQAGITNAVAPLGTAFTDEQAKLLRRWAERLILVFDSDEAGQAAVVKGILTARKNGLPCAVVVPEGQKGEKIKDPADILKENGPEILQKSVKCYIYDFEYLVNRGKSLFNISNAEGKAKAVAFLFPYLEVLDSQVLRDDCITAMAGAFDTDPAAILDDYNRRHSGVTHAREEVPRHEKPVRMNDELFLLTVFSLNLPLYLKYRTELKIEEVDDPDARELFIALEECFVNEEGGIDDLLSRISSAPLRNFIAERGTSEEFKKNPEQLIRDGLKRAREKGLKRRLSEIVRELRGMETKSVGVSTPERDVFRGDSDMEELLAEKMHIDAELRQLKGR